MNKIYLVFTPFFPTQNNFRGPFIYDQCKAIEKNSAYNIIVFKPKSLFSKEKDYEFEGFKVYRFKTFNLPSNLLPGIFNFIGLFFLYLKFKKIKIDDTNVEIVHIHGIHLAYLSGFFKQRNKQIKTILQFHGLDVFGLKQGKFSKYFWNKAWIISHSRKFLSSIDLFIGVSQKTLDHLNQLIEIPQQKQLVLYNGVDKSKFYPIKGLKNPNNFIVGCIGNFIPIKDQITLIKAVNHLKKKGINDIVVKFIGTGPTLQTCKNYVKDNQMDGHIAFLPEIAHEQLIYFYNSLDLFILPSYYESFGCVFTEAFSCEVPFLAVRGQGIEELIDNKEKDKWLFDKGDYKQLANLIINYRKNKEEQLLNNSIDINQLISRYLDNIRSF